MYFINQYQEDRNVLLRFPEFYCHENAGRKERQAIRRMNDFYRTTATEILAYCGEIAKTHPKMLYLMEGSCTAGVGEARSIPREREEIPIDVPLSVQLALTLRFRPNPTRRKRLTHTWQGGYLVKPAPSARNPKARPR